MDPKNELLDGLTTSFNGGAICILGSGFSVDARDINGDHVPGVAELIKEICELIGEPYEAELTLSEVAYHAESLSEEYGIKLRRLLLERLTKTIPTDYQKHICSIPWRSIYTTNYDDVVEQANNEIQVFRDDSNQKISSKSTTLFYLHGRALDIIEQSSLPHIVLSERSYNTVKHDVANILEILENDIYTSTRIFVIGYSFRDQHIRDFFAQSSTRIREKVIIVTAEGSSNLQRNRLSNYGTVFPIGTEKLGKMINGFSPPCHQEPTFSFLKKFVQPTPQTVTSDAVTRLLLTGLFESEFYQNQIQAQSDYLYCAARRKAATRIFDLMKSGRNRLVVTSDLGNGKTTFLYQIATELSVSRQYIFFVDSGIQEVFQEISTAIDLFPDCVFIVDDAIRYKPVIRYLSDRMSGNQTVIVSGRSQRDDDEDRFYNDILGASFSFVDLNKIDKQELELWDSFLERWGLWGDLSGQPSSRRISYLENECGGEVRSIVINLFRESSLANKITKLTQFFVKTHSDFRIPFIALLISGLCQQHVRWERIVNWFRIDEHRLQKLIGMSELRDVFLSGRDWNICTSPILAEHILFSYDFDDEELVHTYVKMIKNTINSSNDYRNGYDAKENAKELMKFRFVTKVFGRASKPALIEAIYERLAHLHKIRQNDQFWLQFAMAKMEYGKYEQAFEYLETAQGIANSKGDLYDDFQIKDQKARLLFKRISINTQYNDQSRQMLSEAISIIRSSVLKKEALIYPLRSASFILEVLDAHCEQMEMEERNKLGELISDMQKAISEEKIGRGRKGEVETIGKALKKSVIVLKNS